MEIKNDSATPNKSNQLRNVNTIRLESRNISTQPSEIDDRISEVTTFVVNAANNFYIKFLYLNYLLCSTEVPLDRYQEYIYKIQGYRWWIYPQDIERCR